MKLKYDPTQIKLSGTTELLQERHPGLSSDEHQDRIFTALHEATHMITAMHLRTGWVGCHAIVRVPRKSTSMYGCRGITGKVQCGADGWESAVVDFAGIAAAFISGDPNINNVCRSDVHYGMETVCKFGDTSDDATLRDIRRELVAKAFQISVRYWEVIDLTATAILLDARKDGGIVGKRFETIKKLARSALDQSSSPSGHDRDVSFSVPPVVSTYVAAKRTLPSSILQLPRTPYGVDYGYPFQ